MIQKYTEDAAGKKWIRATSLSVMVYEVRASWHRGLLPCGA